MMNNNSRMEALKNSGIDTSKYFTLTAEQDIPKGTKISIAIDTVNDPVAKEIVENGYVKNTRLHRRFVAAHYFRLLESPMGWHKALNTYYSYMYQFDMMLEEVRVLSKLEKNDRATFNERRMFFTFSVVNDVLNDYVEDLKQYLSSLKIRHCKGRPYVRIPSRGDVFADLVESEIITPIESIVRICSRCHTYSRLYENLRVLRGIMVKLPHDIKKSKTWIDAFQAAGAFYTLKNLMMFHEVRLYYADRFYDVANGMQLLTDLAGLYEGYQLNGLLKETIKQNNFNFKKSIEDHK